MSDLTAGEFVADFFDSFTREVVDGGDAAAVVDRYYTPDIEQIADGVTLDRQRLIDHLRPIRKNLVAWSYDVHEALRSGDRLAARFHHPRGDAPRADDLDRGVSVRRGRGRRPAAPYDAGDAGCERVMTTFQVAGMSCGHCVRFVTDELEAVPGVESVAVDLPTSTVTVVSDRALEPTTIRAAIEAAGYELVD